MSVNAATRYMGIKMTKKELKQRFSNLYKKRESFYESHRDMAAKIGFEDWRKNEFFQYFCEGAKDLEKENAELKHTIATLRQEKDNTNMHAKAMEVVAKTRSDQLTKAKFLLKQLVDAFPKSYSDVVKDTLDEARKFVEE